MFIISNFISALAVVINYVLEIYLIILIARVVISWVNPDPYNPIVRFLHRTTDPLLWWIRRRLPFLIMGGIDLTPIVAFLIIIFLQKFLVSSLYQLAIAVH